MALRFAPVLLLFLMACQSSWIPCPEAKAVKFKKSNAGKGFRESYASLTANANDNSDNLHNKGTRTNDGRTIKNVTVEDWDCPHPGQKKYMPRAVKENIRRNMRKLKSASQAESDSTSSK